MGTLSRYSMAMMMKRALLALTMLAGLSVGNAMAKTTTDSTRAAAINADIQHAIAQVSAPTAVRCAASPTLRIAMYAAQATDGFTTGAAVQHGAIGRTPFGTTNVATALVTQAAFDTIVDLLTRHASCKTKDLIHAAIGGSALFNALQAGSQQ